MPVLALLVSWGCKALETLKNQNVYFISEEDIRESKAKGAIASLHVDGASGKNLLQVLRKTRRIKDSVYSGHKCYCIV